MLLNRHNNQFPQHYTKVAKDGNGEYLLVEWDYVDWEGDYRMKWIPRSKRYASYEEANVASQNNNNAILLHKKSKEIEIL